MSLPILHSFAGYAIYKVTKRNGKKTNWYAIGAAMLLGNLADFDFIPGVIMHKADLIHRGPSHSVGAAFIAGSVCAAAYYLWKKRDFIRVFYVSSLAYFTHIALDFFTNSPRGVRFWWPFYDGVILSPFYQYVEPPAGAPTIEAARTVWDMAAYMMSPMVLTKLMNEFMIVYFILASTYAIRWARAKNTVFHPGIVVRCMVGVVLLAAYLYEIGALGH